jgi:hypothetical protein
MLTDCKSAASKGLTIKQAAEVMNVSERMIYMARAVQRSRPDLADKIAEGTMSMAEAYRLTTKKPKPTSYSRLVKAWNAASTQDQGRLLAELSLSTDKLDEVLGVAIDEAAP